MFSVLRADFDKQYSLTLRSVSHCRYVHAVEHPLNSALNLHALHGHRSKRSICHGLIFSLIKFTLRVSSTPSCDESLIWQCGALFPRVKLTYVYLCRPGSTSPSSLSYGGMPVGGRPAHSPAASPPCQPFFVPGLSPESTSVFSVIYLFFSPSFSLFWLSFLPS